MLFRRILIREMTSLLLAVFFLLLLIIVVTQSVNLLRQISMGTLASSAIWGVIGFYLVRFFPLLLSLSLFITVLSTLIRVYKDHEMMIWFSSGQSLLAFIRPVLQFAALPIVLIGFLSLIVTPWAIEQTKELRILMAQQELVSQISSGVFRSNENVTYFAENLGEEITVGANIFVQQKYQNKLNIIIAERGELLEESKKRSLLLENGVQYLGTPGSADYVVSHFERGTLPIYLPKYEIEQGDIRTENILVLLKESTGASWTELQGRLSWPIGAFIFVLIAIPLASHPLRRGGGSLPLIVGILMFSLYQSMLKIAQTWLEEGLFSPWIGAWPIHLITFAIMMTLFWWRKRVR